MDCGAREKVTNNYGVIVDTRYSKRMAREKVTKITTLWIHGVVYGVVVDPRCSKKMTRKQSVYEKKL